MFRGFPEPARPVEEVTTREIAHWIAGDLDTDALREFHALVAGRKYRYRVSLFEVDLADVHAETRNTEHGTHAELLGYDEFLEGTSNGGPALRGTVPTHNGYWKFVIDRDSHRPIAAYRITYAPYVPPAPRDGVAQPIRFEVPFVCTEPVDFSMLTDDDDLINRDVVQRVILAEAARLHPTAKSRAANRSLNGSPTPGLHDRIPRTNRRPANVLCGRRDRRRRRVHRPGGATRGLRVVGPGEI
ncbi:hypothetical protein GS506_04655 [Rhodococcus hoagii]|nr:hypothetical protein [Prescottella equi]